MRPLTPDQWRLLSPYVDQALSIEETQRVQWLKSLSQQHPEIAEKLVLLLDDHRALRQEGFLEHPLPRPEAELASPCRMLGVYRLDSKIGEGGMGSVWLGRRHDGKFDRDVAIKFLRSLRRETGDAKVGNTNTRED